jgi:hypothetical protein
LSDEEMSLLKRSVVKAPNPPVAILDRSAPTIAANPVSLPAVARPKWPTPPEHLQLGSFKNLIKQGIQLGPRWPESHAGCMDRLNMLHPANQPYQLMS